MLGWFPGHMNKARRQIKDALPEIDVVIEVLDARLPYSSANPMLAELTRHKPVLKILSRADLADPVRTDEWVAFFDAQADTRALAITTTNTRELKKIPKLCHELAGAVTKRQQKVRIDGRVALIDTPGVLWPKIEDQASAYRLAASGAIRDTAIEYTDVAIVASAELAKRYPAELTARYKLKALPTYEAPVVEEVDADGPKKPDFLAIAGFDGHAILKEIAGKRGGLRPGGEVDLHRGAEVLLHELRDGKLGRVTLETPADIPPPPAQNDQDSPASSDA
jgi:ribosome biogenesis GTPase A